MLLDEFALYKHLALSLYTLAPKYLYAVLRMKVFFCSPAMIKWACSLNPFPCYYYYFFLTGFYMK